MNLATNLIMEGIAYFCECITQLLCIHAFLEKKIKADVKTVIFIITNILVLTLINKLQWMPLWTFMIFLLIGIYVWLEFKLKVPQIIILIVLDLLAVAAMQIIAIMPLYLMFPTAHNDNAVGMLGSILALGCMIVFTRWVRLNNLYTRLMKWDREIIAILSLCGILVLYLLIKYKTKRQLVVWAYFISAIMICIVIAMIFHWQKDRYEMKQKSLELHMHELYGKTFEGMVENMRIRQHDFKNQLAAIYGMHLTAQSFEELVDSQKAYCDYLMRESHYDTILTKCKDKILAGFLYTKFNECEKKGLEIDFEISVCDPSYTLATYELIEIIGIVLDNAVEYEIENKKGKELYFKIEDNEETLNIVCRNKADYIPVETISKFFQKGYSSKGEGRGIGLYNVKKMIESNGEIIVSNKTIDDNNWIEFHIAINRN